MSKPKIAIFGWPDSIHVRRWAQALSAREYQIKVIGVGRGAVPGIESVVYPRRGKLSYLLSLGPARRELDRFEPDIIHVHYASSFGLWIVGLTERPNVVSVWGSDILKFPSNVVKKALLGRVFHYASAITATSLYLRDQTVGKYPRTADRARIIPFGVSPCENEIPLPETEELRICVLKSHRRIYGQDVLLKAAGRLHKRGVKLQLSLPGGPGPETRYYQELANRLGLSEVVSFGGWLAPDEVYPFIGRHHVMVLPSRSEGFGVAALEASACGRPVIASKVGGLPEVVEDGHTGILVDPGGIDALSEAITKLAKDRPSIQSMGAAGREFVRNSYLWEHSLDQMESLYEELLSR